MSKKTRERNEDQGEIVGIYSNLDSESMQRLFEERAKRAAFSLGVELLEQEVVALCGARYSRSGAYSCHGSEGTISGDRRGSLWAATSSNTRR